MSRRKKKTQKVVRIPHMQFFADCLKDTIEFFKTEGYNMDRIKGANQKTAKYVPPKAKEVR